VTFIALSPPRRATTVPSGPGFRLLDPAGQPLTCVLTKVEVVESVHVRLRAECREWTAARIGVGVVASRRPPLTLVWQGGWDDPLSDEACVAAALAGAPLNGWWVRFVPEMVDQLEAKRDSKGPRLTLFLVGMVGPGSRPPPVGSVAGETRVVGLDGRCRDCGGMGEIVKDTYGLWNGHANVKYSCPRCAGAEVWR